MSPFRPPFDQLTSGNAETLAAYLKEPPWKRHRRDYYRRVLSKARAALPEREKEVALAVLLGAREERVGFWGMQARRGVAHFWVRMPRIVGREVVVAACGRYRTSLYGGAADEDVRETHDVGTRARVCGSCAYLVETERA